LGLAGAEPHEFLDASLGAVFLDNVDTVMLLDIIEELVSVHLEDGENEEAVDGLMEELQGLFGYEAFNFDRIRKPRKLACAWHAN
jgi:hypothetical protein